MNKRHLYYRNLPYKILFEPNFANDPEKIIDAWTKGLLHCVVCLNNKDYYEFSFATVSYIETDLCIGIINLVIIPDISVQQIHLSIWACAFAGHDIFFDSVKKSLPSKFKNYRPSVAFNLQGFISESNTFEFNGSVPDEK